MELDKLQTMLEDWDTLRIAYQADQSGYLPRPEDWVRCHRRRTSSAEAASGTADALRRTHPGAEDRSTT